MARYTITIEVEAEEGDVDATDMRPAVNGMLDRCGLRAAESVEVREGGDAGESAYRLNRLRTLASAGQERLSAALFSARLRCNNAGRTEESAERVASMAMVAALAEAREKGYRAAVADLLGALEVGT
jgi:hypothetical protein